MKTRNTPTLLSLAAVYLGVWAIGFYQKNI